MLPSVWRPTSLCCPLFGVLQFTPGHQSGAQQPTALIGSLQLRVLPALCPRLLSLIRRPRIPKATSDDSPRFASVTRAPRRASRPTAGVHDLIGTLQLRVLLTPLRFRYSGTPPRFSAHCRCATREPGGDHGGPGQGERRIPEPSSAPRHELLGPQQVRVIWRTAAHRAHRLAAVARAASAVPKASASDPAPRSPKATSDDSPRFASVTRAPRRASRPTAGVHDLAPRSLPRSSAPCSCACCQRSYNPRLSVR